MAFFTELAIRNIPNDYSFKNNYLEERAQDVEILILGNSHSFYGINPSYFEAKTFNAAYVSQSLDYDLEISQKFLGKLPHLKLLIINVSYGSLFNRLGESTEDWRLKNYELYYGIKTPLSIFEKTEILNGKLQNDLDRIFQYYFLKEKMIDSDNSGFLGRPTGSKQDFLSSGLKAARRHTAPMDHLDGNIVYLDSIIKLAKLHHVQILIVTPPALPQYTEHLDQKQLIKTIEVIEKLSDTFPRVYYKNFLRDVEFTENLFYDSDHLSSEGAEVFSKKLNSIVQSQILNN